jgi:hypothetical protein
MLKGFSFYFLSVVVVVLFHGSPVCCRYLVYIYLYIHLLHCFTYLPVLSWLAVPTRQPAAAAAGYIEAIYLYIKATWLCWATRICVCVCRTVWLEGSNGSRRERERERLEPHAQLLQCGIMFLMSIHQASNHLDGHTENSTRLTTTANPRPAQPPLE